MTNSNTTFTEPLIPSPDPRVGPAARTAIRLVRGYQALMAGRPSPCRFYPTCSTYAVEALSIHGARRGVSLAIRRVLRCNPWGTHGIDLVPLPKEKVTPQ